MRGEFDIIHVDGAACAKFELAGELGNTQIIEMAKVISDAI